MGTSNNIVALNYLNAAIGYSKSKNPASWSVYEGISKIIASLDFDVYSLFARKKSLESMQVEGIGAKTKSILEEVLRKEYMVRGNLNLDVLFDWGDFYLNFRRFDSRPFRSRAGIRYD